MNTNNDNVDKIKKALEKEPVPEELSPENVKKMLDEKAPAKKRSRIRVGTRIAAGAAACAVVGASAVYFGNQSGLLDKDRKASRSEMTSGLNYKKDGDKTEKVGSYMSGASDYSEIYTLFGESYKRVQKSNSNTVYGEAEIMEDSAAESAAPADNGVSEATGASSDTGSGEFYETYDQEQDVLEADAVKTDGERIYHINNYYEPEEDGLYYNDVVCYLEVAAADNGTLTPSAKINLSDIFGGYYTKYDNSSFNVDDMYLYNDMVVVIGSGYSYSDDDYSECYTTCAAFFTAGDDPQLIDVYSQDGAYSDVRISPDGYLYLVSNYETASYTDIEDENMIAEYIPACGVNDDINYLAAGDIFLPEEGFVDSYNLSYTLIGSIDLNTSGAATPVQTKALAGYMGSIYCSSDNLYTAYGWDDTDITRFSIGAGEITPVASCTIEGVVKDQFSMSEYNGYFRVAATKDTYKEIYHEYDYTDDDIYWWDAFIDSSDDSGYYTYKFISRENRVYVLDLDLNEVGSVKGFGEDENIKSVSFSGDMAYVVTYRQIDPLFSIDLSDPTSPVILDELELPGYSTYMQQWGDGQLLGFGVADDNGISNGVKLVMFDNSDPNELRQTGSVEILGSEDETSWISVYSEAQWERKALMIAPEKNLIAVPICRNEYNYSSDSSYDRNEYYYVFFSYENGEFVQRGMIEPDTDSSDTGFNRAIYIGDYVYVVVNNTITAADIETFTVTDSVTF